MDKKTKFNYIKKFDEKAIDLIINLADGNVRRLLEYTDMIFDFHHRTFKEINPIGRVTDFERELPREKGAHFEYVFSPLQQRILEFLSEFDRVTIAGIAKKLKISMSTARKSIAALKKKKAFIVAGKKKLLVIAPSVRRLMVKE